MKHEDILNVVSLLTKSDIHSFGILAREKRGHYKDKYVEERTGIRLSGIEDLETFKSLLEKDDRESLEVYVYMKDNSRISINLITSTLVIFKNIDVLPLGLLRDMKLVGDKAPITDVRILF